MILSKPGDNSDDNLVVTHRGSFYYTLNDWEISNFSTYSFYPRSTSNHIKFFEVEQVWGDIDARGLRKRIWRQFSESP